MNGVSIRACDQSARSDCDLELNVILFHLFFLTLVQRAFSQPSFTFMFALSCGRAGDGTAQGFRQRVAVGEIG